MNNMTFTTITDLTAYIAWLMGAEGDDAAAEAMAQNCWSDGDRSSDALDARWPNEADFYAAWDEADEAMADDE
jgi:hypothetical protein